MGQRETAIEETFAKWEKARASERQRLRAELDFWVADREKMAKAAADSTCNDNSTTRSFHLRRPRMAAEELAAAAVKDSGSERMKRRLAVLRRAGNGSSISKVKEIDNRRTEVAAELTALTERYQRAALASGKRHRARGGPQPPPPQADLRTATTAPGPARPASLVVPELAALPRRTGTRGRLHARHGTARAADALRSRLAVGNRGGDGQRQSSSSSSTRAA